MASPRPTILLFDIDGTLVTTAGAGRRALDAAFKALWGKSDACAAIRFDGMTDWVIARLGLEAIGIEVTDARMQAVLDLYVPLLASELQSLTPDRYRIHPGIISALNEARRAGAALGLGTGNIEAGARLKLEHVDLLDYFAFGGYGSDSAERPELIRCGAVRGAALLGRAIEQCRVVVIGDTPKDIAAAMAIGAESIGVATGSFSVQQLKEAGATHAFADLTAPGAITALLATPTSWSEPSNVSR